jgi:hypothetical protein
MELDVPADTGLARLREDLAQVGKDHNIDITLTVAD